MDGISRTFFNRRSAVLLLLGFSSGLPLAVSGDLVAAWLTDAKVDVARIGLLGLVGLPYALKFVWSPVVDRYVPPFLGRRRGWLLLTQLLLAGAIVGLSLARPAASLAAVAVAATAVAFSARRRTSSSTPTGPTSCRPSSAGRGRRCRWPGTGWE